eukprot:SAG31_NODE_919_length_11010_cov_27.449821_8_plen_701_part_00
MYAAHATSNDEVSAQVAQDSLFDVTDCLESLLLRPDAPQDARQMVFAVLRAHSHSLVTVADTREQEWITFARNVFHQMVDVVPPDAPVHLCAGFIHFEFHHGLPNATENDMVTHGRQAAKHLMGQQKWISDTNSWAAYAQVEERLGNIREAQKIYDTALVMCRSGLASSKTSTSTKWGQGPNEAWRSSLQIRRAYAELELQCDNAARAVHVLASGFGNDGGGFQSIKIRSKGKQKPPPPLTPTQLLTARNAYKDLLSTGSTSNRSTVHAVVCHALLEFLVVGFSAMCSVFNDAMEGLFAKDFQRTKAESRIKCNFEEEHSCQNAEALVQAYSILSFTHSMTVAGVPPRVLRGILQTGLSSFPGNTALLAMFNISESRAHVLSNVRRHFINACKSDGTTPEAAWLFALYYEMSRVQRHENRPSTSALTAFFEKALEVSRDTLAFCSCADGEIYGFISCVCVPLAVSGDQTFASHLVGLLKLCYKQCRQSNGEADFLPCHAFLSGIKTFMARSVSKRASLQRDDESKTFGLSTIAIRSTALNASVLHPLSATERDRGTDSLDGRKRAPRSPSCRLCLAALLRVGLNLSQIELNSIIKVIGSIWRKLRVGLNFRPKTNSAIVVFLGTTSLVLLQALVKSACCVASSTRSGISAQECSQHVREAVHWSLVRIECSDLQLPLRDHSDRDALFSRQSQQICGHLHD